METILTVKQQQFNDAMKKYEEKRRYVFFNKCVSVTNMMLQLVFFFLVLQLDISALLLILAIVIAYLFTDFFNGLVHMYMDNNDDYTSIVGPFVASFHLHHKNPRYKKHMIPVVYFNESGSKFWLVLFLAGAVPAALFLEIHPFILYTLCLFGTFSSVAEVSHYLCHNSNTRLTLMLEKMRLLMPKKHHARHHLEDNLNYAFLNGLSDPLINLIARRVYGGYKHGTDKHFEHYTGAGTSNRG